MNKISVVLFAVFSVALSVNAEEKKVNSSQKANMNEDVFKIRRPSDGYSTNVSYYPDSRMLTKDPCKLSNPIAKFVVACFNDGNYYSEVYGEGNWRSGTDIYQFPRLWKWGKAQYRDGVSINIVVSYPLCNGNGLPMSDDWAGTITADWTFKHTPFDLLSSIF